MDGGDGGAIGRATLAGYSPAGAAISPGTVCCTDEPSPSTRTAKPWSDHFSWSRMFRASMTSFVLTWSVAGSSLRKQS